VVWYGMVNVDLYSAIITKVSNALWPADDDDQQVTCCLQVAIQVRPVLEGPPDLWDPPVALELFFYLSTMHSKV